MSVVSSVNGGDQDGLYGGQKKRPLSIIEEDDSDEGDAAPTPVTGDNNIIHPAPEINAKEIVIETKVSSTAETQPGAKTNGVKSNDKKKKPQNIDTSLAKTQSSDSKPQSPSSKTPIFQDYKTFSKILHFSKSIQIAPETDSKSKVPPPVAPKPKTPSPSPSKVKGPFFPSQTGDRHFANKSPTCSQSKKTVPKSKTSDTQTSEAEVVRSMKNIVKRTVSRIENHVASMASSTIQKVKGDPPKRKISKEEAPASKPPLEEKENSTPMRTSTSEADKSVPTSASTLSSNMPQESSQTLDPASPADAGEATGIADSTPLSENPKNLQTSTTPPIEEADMVASTPISTMESNETENLTTTEKYTPTSNETDSPAATPTLPTNDAVRPPIPRTSSTESSGTENPIAITISTPDLEVENQTASTTSMSSSEADEQSTTRYSQPTADETENSSSNDTEFEDALRHQVYQVDNSQLSASESSSAEFTTPPSSPPMPHSKQISSVLFSSPLLSSKMSHSSSEVARTSGSGSNSRSVHILSDGQGLARIREAAESLKLTSSSPLIPKTSPSSPGRKVPFSFRQSPKLGHRPLSEGYSLSSLNNAKGQFKSNALSVNSQFSTKGDSGTSDSENEDKSQCKSGDKSRVAPRSPFLMPKVHPRRGSYFFKRRISSESLASLSENESTDNGEEPTPISASDFTKLKETADRLHLSTRRPSVLQWRQQYVESPGASGFSFKSGMNGDSLDEKLTSDRKQKIDEALEWLRNELHEMRSQDQILARQLLTIRNDIHQLKLRRCTTEHQELLDDFKLEIEEQQEFSDVLDIPQPIYEDNPLKHIGVTRLNISARRFSAC